MPASRLRLNERSGGRSEALVNEPIVMPRISPFPLDAVTTDTGDGTWRMIQRSASPSSSVTSRVAPVTSRFASGILHPIALINPVRHHVKTSLTLLKKDLCRSCLSGRGRNDSAPSNPLNMVLLLVREVLRRPHMYPHHFVAAPRTLQLGQSFPPHAQDSARLDAWIDLEAGPSR